MDVDELWSNKTYRKMFLPLCVSILLVLIGTRYFILPLYNPALSRKWTEFEAEFIGELTTSLAATVFLGLFLFYVSPRVMRRARIEAIEPKSISPLLREAALTSSSWVFKGGMGRYTRAETLPALAKQGRNSGSLRKIVLMLIDPDDLAACKSYALYRSGLKSSGESSGMTGESVRDQILATIVAAAKVGLTEAMLDIQIVLLSSWAVLRVDASDRYAIVTSEDVREPGLRIDKGTHFYEAYVTDLNWIAKQGRLLPKLNSDLDISLSKPSEIAALVSKLALKPDGIDVKRYELIWNLSRERSHIYG